MTSPAPLLTVEHLARHFPARAGWLGKREWVRAVDDVSFTVARGETLGLVGESGSGKTTLGRCILRLDTPSTGRVVFDGADVHSLPAKPLRALRRRMQIVFQDPFGSLNPRMTAGETVAEPIVVHKLATGSAVRDRVEALFREVGLDASHLDQYPHELSGGQCQRVGIARALSVEPEFVLLDEPVSALDVSVQAQVLNLLGDLQKSHRLTYLFIAHNLAVVRHVATRVAVMYLGKLVEVTAAAALYERPRHPYTTSLLSAVPVPDPGAQRERIVLAGDPPSPRHPPPGCPFHPRCPHPKVNERCRTEVPELREVAPGHWAACHFGESPM